MPVWQQGAVESSLFVDIFVMNRVPSWENPLLIHHGTVWHTAEIIKRRIMGLHQNTQIGSVDITDTWEPLEEGLNRLETTRHVSVITITLSTAMLDTTTVGYQAPIENELVKPLQEASAPSRPRNPGRCVVSLFPVYHHVLNSF